MTSVKRALVAYSMSSTHVQTTLDYLNSFREFSGFETEFVHVTHDALLDFDFDRYDVIFHSYCARLCFDGYVSDSYKDRLRAFTGVKVLAVQDEYDRTNTLKTAIAELGFDIVLTCVPQDSLEYVYPRSEFPAVTFLTVFTGYVPEGLSRDLPARLPLARRPIFIGYRGRDIGGRYGRLAFDKFEIGRRMKEICDRKHIATDIAMDEASRIYGTAWFDFIGDCRAMLGSESGSNVFDFDGSIEARYLEMTAANGNAPPSYADFLPMVADRDREIDMGQISPRVFECALMRTPMVLFKGRYSDALRPDEHYIALEKDFSNADEVLRSLNDLPRLDAMAQRAFDHLVASGQFTYRAFHHQVGKVVAEALATRSPGPDRAAEPGRPSGAGLDANLAIVETPTPGPLGADGLRFRLDAAEAILYRREFEGARDEFLRLRDIFVTELTRLDGILGDDKVASPADGPADPSGHHPNHATDSFRDINTLLAAFDADLAQITRTFDQATRDFRRHMDGGNQSSAESAVRRRLELAKTAYQRMVDWRAKLNAVYELEKSYRDGFTLRPRILLVSAKESRTGRSMAATLDRIRRSIRRGIEWFRPHS